MLNLFSMETNADIKLITHREASNSGDVKYGSRKALTEESHKLRLKKKHFKFETVVIIFSSGKIFTLAFSPYKSISRICLKFFL